MSNLWLFLRSPKEGRKIGWIKDNGDRLAKICKKSNFAGKYQTLNHCKSFMVHKIQKWWNTDFLYWIFLLDSAETLYFIKYKYKLSSPLFCWPNLHFFQYTQLTSTLLTQYNLILSSSELYWPSTTMYQPVPPHTDQVPPNTNQHRHLLSQYYHVSTSSASY